ncbi:DUF2971 domain-containing protein [Parasphingopyxis lamellibrachiae]|uniref:DUF2971 family protein n=1 Tax=Parasphingopyxis lamellibrachiae TaxID=680125 RepID=A0A3D9FGZ5_9SPHN|nr:DUF2971 domain-containing protein [Parasphingopyxis lamellibrachiae]RED17070.1 hypothetical protein DFR46_2105 [Parasphingopyxis lamellibrachiae]
MTLVYHFTKERWARQAVINKRLKIARIADLNDPFELMGLRVRDKRTRQAFLSWKDEMNRRYGILCFSRNWQSPLLWSHYADRHRGICLGLEVRSDYLKSIKYQKTRKDFRNEALDEKLLDYLLFTKFHEWSYEDELRLCSRLETPDSTDDQYYSELNEDIRLREIIIGPLNELRRADILSDLEKAKIPPGKIRLIKARLAHKSFAIVRDKRGLI